MKTEQAKGENSNVYENFSAGLNILGGLGGFEKGAPIAKDYEEDLTSSKRKVSII